MKTNHKKKTLTFGDFITDVYGACGKRMAEKILRHAVNSHLVVFRGHHRYFIP